MRIANLQDRLAVARGKPGDDSAPDLAYDVEATPDDLAELMTGAR
jgi:hypothetical protein